MVETGVTPYEAMLRRYETNLAVTEAMRRNAGMSQGGTIRLELDQSGDMYCTQTSGGVMNLELVGRDSTGEFRLEFTLPNNVRTEIKAPDDPE
jgi:hypothetical protein